MNAHSISLTPNDVRQNDTGLRAIIETKLEKLADDNKLGPHQRALLHQLKDEVLKRVRQLPTSPGGNVNIVRVSIDLPSAGAVKGAGWDFRPDV